jgi:ribonucleoside-triphosphate reductase (thioredoxin)
MDYTDVAESIYKNGEPGLCWLENMREYSRMEDPKDFKDIKAGGGNPCLEQTLESHEMCCLVETFPHNH